MVSWCEQTYDPIQQNPVKKAYERPLSQQSGHLPRLAACWLSSWGRQGECSVHSSNSGELSLVPPKVPHHNIHGPAVIKIGTIKFIHLAYVNSNNILALCRHV